MTCVSVCLYPGIVESKCKKGRVDSMINRTNTFWDPLWLWSCWRTVLHKTVSSHLSSDNVPISTHCCLTWQLTLPLNCVVDTVTHHPSFFSFALVFGFHTFIKLWDLVWIVLLVCESVFCKDKPIIKYIFTNHLSLPPFH